MKTPISHGKPNNRMDHSEHRTLKLEDKVRNCSIQIMTKEKLIRCGLAPLDMCYLWKEQSRSYGHRKRNI